MNENLNWFIYFANFAITVGDLIQVNTFCAAPSKRQHRKKILRHATDNIVF